MAEGTWGSVPTTRLRGPGVASPRLGSSRGGVCHCCGAEGSQGSVTTPPWASSCQHPPAGPSPTAANGSRAKVLHAGGFACDSLNVSHRDHRVVTMSVTVATPLLLVTQGSKPPATPPGW